MVDDAMDHVRIPKSFYRKAMKADDGFKKEEEITQADGDDPLSKVLRKVVKNIENTDDGMKQVGADHKPQVLKEEKEVFVCEDYKEPYDPNDDKLMTEAEYKRLYEPEEAKAAEDEKTLAPATQPKSEEAHR